MKIADNFFRVDFHQQWRNQRGLIGSPTKNKGILSPVRNAGMVYLVLRPISGVQRSGDDRGDCLIGSSS